MASRGGGSFIGGGIYMYIDATDFFEKVNYCKGQMSEQNFQRIIKMMFNDIGRRLETPIAKEIQKHYVVTQEWVRSQMLSPIISPNEIRVPLKGQKGSIGGRFPARGRKNGRVSANIVRGGVSVMPPKMTHQGGNPPFMAKEVCFTRKGPARFPIVGVKGLAVPQMPLNRAADDVQDRILEMAEKRLVHYMSKMF